MSENYIRKCSIKIDALGKTYTADGIRVRFSTKQATLSTTQTAVVRLTNMLRTDAEKLCKPPGNLNTPITISAGYEGNEGMIFTGHTVRMIYGRESPTDTLCQIMCTSGNLAISHAWVSKTFPAGSKPQDHFDEAAQAMSKYSVKKGVVGKGVDLSKPVYPRSVTLFGMASKVFHDIAHSKGANWNINNLKINMLKPSDSIPGGTFELNSATGLIGMPSLTPEGVFCRALINPQMQMDSLVHIDQSLIQGYLPELDAHGDIVANQTGPAVASIASDGIYRIVTIDHDADTRGQPWYMDMLVLKPSESTPTSRDAGSEGTEDAATVAAKSSSTSDSGGIGHA